MIGNIYSFIILTNSNHLTYFQVDQVNSQEESDEDSSEESEEHSEESGTYDLI